MNKPLDPTSLLRAAFAKPKPVILDSAEEDNSFDSASAAATDIALSAAAAVAEWARTSDLDDGESNADRLLAMLVGIADANKDGELDDDEQEMVSEALNAAFDYLVKHGVPEDDAAALLDDWSPEAADRIKDLLASSLPDGDDETMDDIDAFAFGDEDQSAVFDAAYKKVFAIRRGKKVRISKRISGKVRLSSKQKVAIKKARLKSHSAKAVMRRMKSSRLRRKMGM